MGRLSRVCLGVLLALLSAVAMAAQPKALILQNNVPAQGNDPNAPDPNLPLPYYVAQSLNERGRVETVVWSPADPGFRSLVPFNEQADLPATPTLAEGIAFARKYRVEYVLRVQATTSRARAELYRNGRLVWQDPAEATEELRTLQAIFRRGQMTKEQYDAAVERTRFRTLQVLPSGMLPSDIENAKAQTARSLARTWAEQLDVEAFKNLPARPVASTPDNAPGQTVPVTVPNTTPPTTTPPTDPPADPPATEPTEPTLAPIPEKAPRVVDNAPLKTQLDALKQSNQRAAALVLLRESIDAAPLNVERRLWLIRLLQEDGQWVPAAEEAQRAASLFTEQITLRLMAARAWMKAGRPDAAQESLNEAIARDPNAPETRILLAQIALEKGETPAALDHLNAVIERQANPEALCRRAVAHAVIGNSVQAEADLKAANEGKLDPQFAEERYLDALAALDRAVQRTGDELRSLFARAQVRRTDPEVRVLLERHQKMTDARLAILRDWTAPALHGKSHEERVLALKLLAQALGDVRTYLTAGEGDAMADARINLGDALKGWQAARTRTDQERGGGNRNAAVNP